MTRIEFYGNLNKYKDCRSFLEHSSSLKGTQKQNAKYYRREGQPGNYRYYYIKEEYDAAKNPKTSITSNEPKYTNSGKDFENNAKGGLVQKYAEIAKQSPKAAAKEFMKEDAVQEYIDYVSEGLADGKFKIKHNKFTLDGETYESNEIVASDSKYSDELNALRRNMRKWINMISEAAGDKGQKDGPGDLFDDEFGDLLDEEFDKRAKEFADLKKEGDQITKTAEGDKYSQEDRWTDYNDARELKEAFDKFSKKVDLNRMQKIYINNYIKSKDYSDLYDLERTLTPDEKSILKSYLFSLQKETFMGKRIRKDGSLRDVK